jgi:acetate CoA/acetoacetate CoA-transferase alpha subunit
MKTISLEQSVAMISQAAQSLVIGGFMAVGTPGRVVYEIVRQNKRDLTVIANDTAKPGKGIGKLVAAKLVRRVTVSHIDLNPETPAANDGQRTGSSARAARPERIRAGGFGLGCILTPTGIGTLAWALSAMR